MLYTYHLMADAAKHFVPVSIRTVQKCMEKLSLYGSYEIRNDLDGAQVENWKKCNGFNEAQNVGIHMTYITITLQISGCSDFPNFY